MTAHDSDRQDPVVVYKTLLRDMIDRRPSGTRQKIALALGKHKSFVSQITNPTYAIPVPAKHLSTIFDLCHFSEEERRTFIEAYRVAHPRRRVQPGASLAGDDATLSIAVPALKSRRRRDELIESILLYAEQAIALAKKWDDQSETRRTGGAEIEKADQRR